MSWRGRALAEPPADARAKNTTASGGITRAHHSIECSRADVSATMNAHRINPDDQTARATSQPVKASAA